MSPSSQANDNFLEYPSNLHDLAGHTPNLQSYHKRLRYQSKRIFDEEGRAAVDFWMYNQGDAGTLTNSYAAALADHMEFY